MRNKKEQYEATAKAILEAVGGSDNISQATHCMTRLRLNLKDNSLVQDDEVKKIQGVIGINYAGGQYQIIIGQSVQNVYDALTNVGNLTHNSSINEKLDENLKEKLTFKSIGSAILNKLAGSLTPIIPMLLTASMFKMFAAVFGPSLLHWVSAKSDLYRLFVLVGDAGFYFFPVIIGYTASKQFKTSPIISMFLGGILIDPNLLAIVTAGKPFSVYGLPMHLVNYSGSLIPIILSVWIMSYIEKFFKKFVPISLSTIFVPLLTIIVMLPLALCILGPLGSFIGNYICQGILAFGKLGGAWAILGIVLIGIFWEFLVLTGMHLLMISMMILVISQAGYDNFVSPGAFAATFAVYGMCLGGALSIHDKKEKALAWSYLVAGLIGGVTEPGLYGLAIRYKRPMVGMMIGGGAGALYGGVTHITNYVIIPVANFIGVTGYLGSNTSNIINAIISVVISFIVSAIATFIIGVEAKKKKLKLVEAN